MQNLTNWAGNYEYQATKVFRPETVSELRHIVATSEKVRMLGSRHSFNDIADTPGALVSMAEFNRIYSVDAETRTATVGGGVTYGELCPILDRAGLAVHNLASLPHISVAGAITTATHGSGVSNGNLATAVSAIEFVTSDGSLVTISSGEEGFEGAVANLGALGAMTKVTLNLIPSFLVRQKVYERLPLKTIFGHFDEIESSGYSVSLFTDWRESFVNQVWVKRIVTGDYLGLPDEFFGARAADGPRHPLPDMPAENCTEQLGIPGPWFERLAHFRMEFTPSSGDELQSEFFVPYIHAVDAIRAVAEMSDLISPLLHISEIRTIAADDLWMSPCYGQDCVGIHFTWKKNWQAVKHVLPMIEHRLDEFDVRPHWGKLFTMPMEKVALRYERLEDFKTLCNRHDPSGKFRNRYLDGLLA